MKPRISLRQKRKSILIPQQVRVKGYLRMNKNSSAMIDPFQRTVNKISPEVKNTIRDIIDNKEHLNPIGTKDHTSGVYTTEISGDTHYFKPTKEEKYFGVIGINKRKKQAFREGIKNDNLGEREILSYDASNILGLNFIPPTKMVKTKNGETGVLQLSSHVFEKNKNPNKLVKMQTEKDIDSKVLKELIDNGNILDVALFDFIIGNTDRHAGNIFLKRVIDNKKPYKETTNLSPIDHGLSFPSHKKDEITHDYTNTAMFLWAAILNPSGKSAKISDSFFKKLSSERTYVEFSKRINNSTIEKEAKDASIFRLRAVMDMVKKKNSATRMIKNPVYAQHATPDELKKGLEISTKFTSKDFLNILTPFLDGAIKNATNDITKQNATWFKECITDFEKIVPFVNKPGRPLDGGGVSTGLPESKRIKFKPLVTPLSK